MTKGCSILDMTLSVMLGGRPEIQKYTGKPDAENAVIFRYSILLYYDCLFPYHAEMRIYQ